MSHFGGKSESVAEPTSILEMHIHSTNLNTSNQKHTFYTKLIFFKVCLYYIQENFIYDKMKFHF